MIKAFILYKLKLRKKIKEYKEKERCMYPPPGLGTAGGYNSQGVVGMRLFFFFFLVVIRPERGNIKGP